MLKKLLHLVLPCAIAAGAALALPAQAAWPDRPIRMILPFPAGSSTDNVARQIASQLGVVLGTTVVVESVPGAGGTLATGRVAKSPADGYTILFTTANHAINPALYPNLPFDTEKDLTAVSLVAEIPELLVSNASAPFSDFAGFVKPKFLCR